MPRYYSSAMPQRPNQSGFTLVEMLVVLMIVAMVSGILFQALERAYRLQERFGAELFNAQQGQMAADWYRQTVQGLHPDYHDGRNKFQGKSMEFSGLTSNPLSGEYGVPTPIIWKIRNNRQYGSTELVYLEEKQETPILVWHGAGARFIYFDDKQSPHDVWPPPLGLPTQLPRQIQLVDNSGNEPINIVASPMGPASPLTRLQDIIGKIAP